MYLVEFGMTKQNQGLILENIENIHKLENNIDMKCSLAHEKSYLSSTVM